MLTDEKRSEIASWFHDEVQGGVCDDVFNLFDKMIEEGVLTDEEFKLHESEICAFVDSNWFTCNGCGWTQPISEQSDVGEWHCNDCMDIE